MKIVTRSTRLRTTRRLRPGWAGPLAAALSKRRPELDWQLSQEIMKNLTKNLSLLTEAIRQAGMSSERLAKEWKRYATQQS